ncbi:MAG: hypothetical protein N3A55_08345 [Methylohalobius sp.]|nr:hypothetical protein [Methylohalobius sp.]
MPIKPPVVLIGLGELGGVFALGFLRAGYPVYPVLRGIDLIQASLSYPPPALALVCVGEDDFHPVLAAMPPLWRDKIGLIQNELMPRDWKKHGLESVSVAVVWFEKRAGQPLVHILDTPVYGSQAPLLAEALVKLGVPIRILPDEQALIFELAKKALYILTVNIAGLLTGGTVGELWQQHQTLARQVAEEVLTILEWRAGQPLPREDLISGMIAGIADCPDRSCLGRRAKSRLARVVEEARRAGIALPCLTGLWQHVNA